VKVAPVTLDGRQVRLEPLADQHAADLFAAGREPQVWAYLWRDALVSVEDTQAWIAEALQTAAAGAQLPFAIVHRASGRAVGSTRYLDIVPADRRLEIGWTWLAREHWRSAVNTECKYLLLRHAFETLGCLRVQLKTDQRNERSQRAIERLGALREGILRKHMILSMKGDYQRWTVMYSIVDDEWPDIKSRLEDRMQAG
jgi:RimJ/RimL family protein N-acetyltransferase